MFSDSDISLHFKTSYFLQQREIWLSAQLFLLAPYLFCFSSLYFPSPPLFPFTVLLSPPFLHFPHSRVHFLLNVISLFSQPILLLDPLFPKFPIHSPTCPFIPLLLILFSYFSLHSRTCPFPSTSQSIPLSPYILLLLPLSPNFLSNSHITPSILLVVPHPSPFS